MLSGEISIWMGDLHKADCHLPMWMDIIQTLEGLSGTKWWRKSEFFLPDCLTAETAVFSCAWTGTSVLLVLRPLDLDWNLFHDLFEFPVCRLQIVVLLIFHTEPTFLYYISFFYWFSFYGEPWLIQRSFTVLLPWLPLASSYKFFFLPSTLNQELYFCQMRIIYIEILYFCIRQH